MSTTTVQQNIIYGLGEGGSVADTTMLAYALRWANAAYRDITIRHQFSSLRTRALFRTTAGQATYQAPSDFSGILVLKDESNSEIIEQVTPEEYQREIQATQVTNETFESDADVAVALDNSPIVQYSETVQNEDEDTTYTRDTDYTMSYSTGYITVLSTGEMSDATDHYISYLHYPKSKPTSFCLEYDSTNARYLFRLRPVPDDEYIGSLLYGAFPSALSGSVNALWTKMEYCLERGGIYYGALELYEPNNPNIERFKRDYETAFVGLVKLDQDQVPKHGQIPLRMKRSDYDK